MSKTLVAVLRGGPSREYDVSMNTGAQVLQHLPDRYEKRDIFISKDGEWHRDGFVVTPHKALDGAHVAFNAMHGEFGEDGQVQKILDAMSIPYTGSAAVPSAVAMNKYLTKNIYTEHKLLTPKHIYLEDGSNLEREVEKIFYEFHMPVVVKAVVGGSSIGVTIVKKYAELLKALEETFAISPAVLVEQYIFGREATCGVIDHFRGEKHYTPFPVEIIHPKDRAFFDYESKYDGRTQEICPARFPDEINNEITRMARAAHAVLGLRHYSRSDFRISPAGRVYILETNTLPGLTSESLFPKSMAAVGCPFPEMLHHLVQLALKA